MPDDELPDIEVPVGLFQDLEDLKAQVAALTAKVTALKEDADTTGEPTAEDKIETTADEADAEDEPQYPPFILLLDSPEYDDELRALTEWVAKFAGWYLTELVPRSAESTQRAPAAVNCRGSVLLSAEA